MSVEFDFPLCAALFFHWLQLQYYSDIYYDPRQCDWHVAFITKAVATENETRVSRGDDAMLS